MFSAVLYYLSQDTINELIEKDYKTAQRLRILKIDFDELINPYIILEILAIVASFVIVLNSESISDKNTLLIILITLFIFGIFFRFVFQAIGIKFANSIAGKLSILLGVISFTFKPVISLLKFLNKSVVGSPNVDESRDEITELVETAHEEGAIEIGEYRILKNIMNFSEILVSDVMTPRTVVFSCSAEFTVDELVLLPELQMHSRIPIWEGESIDDGIIGYIMSKDVLFAALNGKGKLKLREFNREVYFIPEKAELDTVLDRFLNRRQHMFMVVDEYGGIEGLITMEDVLETILGVEIVDEVDKVVDLRQLAKQRRDSRIASLS
jgi:CBS domain containing-hemolysin-like protein